MSVSAKGLCTRRPGLPPYGGDTAWADMQLAYERLPDDVREQIEGLYAIHSYEKVFGANRTGYRHAADGVVEKPRKSSTRHGTDRSNAPRNWKEITLHQSQLRDGHRWNDPG